MIGGEAFGFHRPNPRVPAACILKTLFTVGWDWYATEVLLRHDNPPGTAHSLRLNVDSRRPHDRIIPHPRAAMAAMPQAAAGAAPDPVSVAPEHYSVLLENDKVRVLEMRLKPGKKSRSIATRTTSCTRSSRLRYAFARGRPLPRF